MRIGPWVVAVCAACGSVLSLQAGELGDKAQPLKVKEWIKGQPVDVTTADGKHVYVVEFWATWCGPCRASIPHLTEMQKKYKDKNVTFIGISDEEPEVVRKFVQQMGDKMDYTVAVDDQRATSKAYMEAFGIRGIPHAFLVDQSGRIIWQDHPMNKFEDVIDQVLAGKFDLEAARKLLAKRQEEERAMQQVFEQIQEYFRLVESKGNAEQAALLGKKILEAGRTYPDLMNQLAWEILTRETVVERDLKLALTAAEAANEATKGENAYVLDTYALALFENGRKKDAIKFQEKAVELARKSFADNKQLLAELEGRLEKFRKESQ